MKIYDELLRVNYSTTLEDARFNIHTTKGTEQITLLKQCIAGSNLVVALDQATVKTGVCFMDFDTRQVLAVADLINDGFPSKSMYFESIYDFLKNHIADEKIVVFAYEIPVEHSPNMRVRQLLESMRLFIRDFKARMPSLSKENMVEINSNTWKSHFLADKAYNGLRKARADVKESARTEAAKRAPDLAEYMFSKSEPPDSCDAVGIAYGALEEIYGPRITTVRRPNRTMAINNRQFKHAVAPVPDSSVAEYVVKRFPFWANGRCEILQFNNTMSVEENCKRYCCNSNLMGIMQINDPKVEQEVKWETQQELKPGEHYMVFCWRD